MPDLRRTRKNLKTALAIMAAVDLLAAFVYFSPLIGSAETRRQELDTLQAELKLKTAQVAPLKDLPQKVVLAGHQISDFYKERFPTQESQVLTELGKLTSANGVAIEHVKYKVGMRKPEGWSRWRWKRTSRATTLRWRSLSTRWSGTRCFLSSTAFPLAPSSRGR